LWFSGILVTSSNWDSFTGSDDWMRQFVRRQIIEWMFLLNSHLRETREFQQCTSLWRIEIPSSGERIKSRGLDE
jgi:hypothetical protein